MKLILSFSFHFRLLFTKVVFRFFSHLSVIYYSKSFELKIFGLSWLKLCSTLSLASSFSKRLYGRNRVIFHTGNVCGNCFLCVGVNLCISLTFNISNIQPSEKRSLLLVTVLNRKTRFTIFTLFSLM